MMKRLKQMLHWVLVDYDNSSFPLSYFNVSLAGFFLAYMDISTVDL
jgi:hypothetical protein